MLWDDRRTSALKQYWAEGLTGSQIAFRLSFMGAPEVTRNAVIGKIHRLGLSGRTTITRPKRAPKPKPVKIDRGGAGFAGFKRAKPVMPPMPAEELSLYKQRILELPPTVHGLEAFEPSCQCGYVHGEPSEQARCGRPKVEGLSYCKEHAELCGQGITVAKRPLIWIKGNDFGRVQNDLRKIAEMEEFTAA